MTTKVKLTDLQLEVLAFCEDNYPPGRLFTHQRVAQLMGLRPTTVAHTLIWLFDKGVLESINLNGQFYRIPVAR